MVKDIHVAESWSQLSEWQLQEIAHLFISATEDNFPETFQKMIFILFQKESGFRAEKNLYQLLNQVTLEDLAPFAKFLIETTALYSFPDIDGLLKPSERLGNIEVKQFSFIDKLFDDWENDRTDMNLRRFVASLYRVHEVFDDLDLPAVAKITDSISQKQRERIALAYKFCRLLIWETYPVIFPKKEETEEEKLRPIFRQKPKYQSFDKIILALVFAEEQPLGTKKEANRTRIWEFMNVLQESILRFKEKEKHHAKH